MSKGNGRATVATVAIAILLGVCALLTDTGQAESHPLHTSLAQIVYDLKQRELQISIKAFVDDFSKASAAYGVSMTRTSQPSNGRPPSESPALAYARSAFIVADANGRRLPLAYCGGKRVDDLIWLCFHTSVPRGIAGFLVSNRILFDLYPDQINIVQVTDRGKKVSLLFTHGEGFKRLE